MKTVMKKLMSLLLVAVLLVSAVPFAASAEEVSSYNVKFVVKNNATNEELLRQDTITETAFYSVEDYLNYWLGSDWSSKYTIASVKVNGEDVGTSFTATSEAIKDGWLKLGVFLNPIAAPQPDPEPTPDPVCGHCGDAHETNACQRWLSCCESLDSHKTTCTTLPCPTSGCELKNGHEGDHSNQCPTCKKIGGGHEDNCAAQPCKTEGCVLNYHSDENHKCVCGIIKPAKGSHHTNTTCYFYEAPPAEQYAYFDYLVDGNVKKTETVLITDGKCTTPSALDVPGYKFYGWLVNNELVDPGKSISATGGQRFNAYYVDTNVTATYKLNVWVRRIVGDTVRETKLLETFSGREQNDNVLDIITLNEASLRNKIEQNYPGYSWSGHVYNYYGEQVKATTTLLTTNGEKNVYLNLYGEENDVLVYVHTATSSAYDRLIEIDGYQTGEAISFNTVLSQVKKYYSGSKMSMKMYSEEGWTNKLNGKSDTDTYSIQVVEGTTKIHVKVYDAYASGSSSSVADSSNPKTGDEIFMAVTAMALSATALAVFFYNKKRAIK